MLKDFHQDGEQATLTINEKGNKHRTIGIHFAAAEALAEYLARAGLEAGPIFRARRAVHSAELGAKPMSESSMYRVIASYVAKLPGAVKEGTRLLMSPRFVRPYVNSNKNDARDAELLPQCFRARCRTPHRPPTAQPAGRHAPSPRGCRSRSPRLA